MTVTRHVLDLLAAQHSTIDRIQDEQTRELARRWVQVWRHLDTELHTQALAIAQLGDDAGVSHIIRRTKAEQAVAMVSADLQRILRQAGDEASQQALAMISLADEHTRALATAQLPPGFTAALLRADQAQLARIAARATQHITVRHYYLNERATESMKQALIESVGIGTSPRDAAHKMVARVRGEFEGSLARAVVIARTEQLDAYRAAAHQTYTANRDVLSGWMWCATLTGRTCPSCLAQHGSIHPLDEPGPLDHHQGRCTGIPVTKPWAQLGVNDIPEPGTAIRPGDGVKWLKKQPQDVQERVMGPKRLAAWKAGSYPPQDWTVRKTHWSRDEHGRLRQDWRDSFHVGPVKT